MLKQIAAGIEGNHSVDQGDLFVFIYGCVYDGINNRSGLGDQVSPASKKKKKSRDLQVTTGLISGAKSCPHLLTVFALDLLQNRMKKLKLDVTNKELLSKLDPFVKLLAECLSSKYEEIVSSSLRCFTSLIRFPLPSLISEAEEVKTVLLTIAQSAVSSSSPLVQSCLKLLTTLLGNKYITLSPEQLKMLIQFPMFVDLESASFVALSLLKAIVKQKLVVPEIYDIAIQVSELMVKSQVESIRKKCKQILLQFMVHYTLSKKRLEQHVNFLLNSLRYEHPTGRVAVLDMLHALILKFSEPNFGKQSILDQHSQTLFLQLTLCLVIDDGKEVLLHIGAVIEFLIGRMSKDQVVSSLLYCLCWYKQQNLRAAAAQVLGFFIDAMKETSQKRNDNSVKKTFQEHIYNTVEDAKTILESAVSASSLQLQDTVEEASLPFWKEAYYSLVMIEKMLEQFPDLSFGNFFEDIWKMVFKLLLHPHEWLRNISCRLLNYYFKTLDGRKRSESQTLVANSLLEKPSSLFMVAVSLCFQLKEQPTTGNVDVKLLTENLVSAVSSLHSLIGQSDRATQSGFWSSLGEDEQVVFLNAFEVLDSGKGRSTFLALTSGRRTENGEEVANDVRNVLIGSLLKRMGKLALDMESVQMRIVFNVYKAFTSQIIQEECRLYAYKILLPLYKVCEGFTGKIITDELKQLAEEVRDSIRDKTLGNQVFVEIYSEIRKKFENKKREEKARREANGSGKSGEKRQEETDVSFKE